jgi:hypothetical protein
MFQRIASSRRSSLSAARPIDRKRGARRCSVHLDGRKPSAIGWMDPRDDEEQGSEDQRDTEPIALPVAGYRPESRPTVYCDLIAKHYATVWTDRGEPQDWEAGRRSDLPTEFSVHRFAPTAARQMWTYATVCMSQESDVKRVELHVFSPVASAAHVELLTAVAHFHRTGSPLEMGHTVNLDPQRQSVI